MAVFDSDIARKCIILSFFLIFCAIRTLDNEHKVIREAQVPVTSSYVFDPYKHIFPMPNVYLDFSHFLERIFEPPLLT